MSYNSIKVSIFRILEFSNSKIGQSYNHTIKMKYKKTLFNNLQSINNRILRCIFSNKWITISKFEAAVFSHYQKQKY